MCLSSPYLAIEQSVDHAERELAKSAHDGIGCDNTQAYYIRLAGSHVKSTQSGVLCLFYLPVQLDKDARDTRMIMYPIDQSHTDYVISSSPFQCKSHLLEAYMCPEKWVEMQTVQTSGPVYRSLSESGTEGSITIPEKPCIVNSDGSRNFFLMLSKMQPPLKTDLELGDMDPYDRGEYMRDMSRAVMKFLVGQLEKEGIPAGYLFDADEEGNIDVVSELAFMNELLPNMSAGTDIFVCIPPTKLVNEKVLPDWPTTGQAAFRLAFHFPEDSNPISFPVPGLCHNMDPSNVSKKEGSEDKVQVHDNYYIWTNTSGGKMAQVFPSGRSQPSQTTNLYIPSATDYREMSVPAGYEWMMPGFDRTKPHLYPEQHYDDPIPECTNETNIGDCTYAADKKKYLIAAQKFQWRTALGIISALNDDIEKMNKDCGHKMGGCVILPEVVNYEQELRNVYMGGYDAKGTATSIVNLNTKEFDAKSTCINIPGLFVPKLEGQHTVYKRART